MKQPKKMKNARRGEAVSKSKGGSHVHRCGRIQVCSPGEPARASLIAPFVQSTAVPDDNVFLWLMHNGEHRLVWQTSRLSRGKIEESLHVHK